MGPRQGFSASDYDRAEWLGVRADDGRLWRVGVIAPEFAWPAIDGQPISVALETDGGARDFAPEEANAVIRGPNGELLFWMGVSGSAEDLKAPPELNVADGGGGCPQSSRCIEEWEQRGMRVTTEGAETVVAYGSQATVGGVSFVNGSLEVQTGGTECLDAFVARAVASAWQEPGSR